MPHRSEPSSIAEAAHGGVCADAQADAPPVSAADAAEQAAALDRAFSDPLLRPSNDVRAQKGGVPLQVLDLLVNHTSTESFLLRIIIEIPEFVTVTIRSKLNKTLALLRQRCSPSGTQELGNEPRSKAHLVLFVSGPRQLVQQVCVFTYAQNGTAPSGTGGDPLRSVKQVPLPPSATAALSDGFEDVSLDDGGARAAHNAQADGPPETTGDSALRPKAAQRIVLFSGALCKTTCRQSTIIITYLSASSARAAVPSSSLMIFDEGFMHSHWDSGVSFNG